MSKPPEELFYLNSISLIDLVCASIDYVKEQGIKTEASSFILNFAKNALNPSSYSYHVQVTTFIERSYKFWPNIKNRDDTFLNEHVGVIFEGLPKNYIKSFNELFSMKDEKDEYVLPADSTRKCVWDHLEQLIKCSIRYIHIYRAPDVETKKYTVSYMGKTFHPETKEIIFPGVSVREQAEIWKVKI